MVSMPPIAVLFFLHVVLAAFILLVAAAEADAGASAISKAGADISSVCVAIVLAWFRREVVKETTLLLST